MTSGQRQRRQDAERRGRRAELIAACLLLAKGYRILGRRYRSPFGEIDIVAVRGRRLAFVEVKARARLDDAAWAVTPRQSQRLTATADHWLQRHARYRDHRICFDRFDVSGLLQWRHHRDALQPLA